MGSRTITMNLFLFYMLSIYVAYGPFYGVSDDQDDLRAGQVVSNMVCYQLLWFIGARISWKPSPNPAIPDGRCTSVSCHIYETHLCIYYNIYY